jgi:DNA-binding NarL/FixJ family response regulator
VNAGPVLRVLVVDDHPLVRRGVVQLLRGEPGLAVVGEAGSGPEAVAAARHLAPDVVVMDARMPGGDGVEATRAITAGGGDGPPAVLMLTTFQADDEVWAALRAGATGYVVKDAAPEELVRAVRAVGAGDGWLDPGVTRRVLADLTGRPTVPPPPVGLDRLTPRETEVLGLVAHGLTNRQLMARLVVSEATVKTHVNRLLLKLACETRAQLVTAAFHAGLVTPGTLDTPAAPDRPDPGRRVRTP